MDSKTISSAVIASFLLAGCAGCAIDPEGRAVTTGSIKAPVEKRAAAKADPKSREETLKVFCAQRHIDYQTGKSPGGAKTDEQKAADDRLCEAIGRQG